MHWTVVGNGVLVLGLTGALMALNGKAEMGGHGFGNFNNMQWIF
jgi:hypothetical protein